MVHVPQSSMPPQPSPWVPQLKPSAMQVVGVQDVPQTLAVPPPPQVMPMGQEPQSMMPPQPSLIFPQLPAMQVTGVEQPLSTPLSGNMKVPVEPPDPPAPPDELETPPDPPVLEPVVFAAPAPLTLWPRVAPAEQAAMMNAQSNPRIHLWRIVPGYPDRGLSCKCVASISERRQSPPMR
jgi:hypothetical protein